MTRILLTNDDGLYAEGLLAARTLLEKIGSVTTVVPDREMSGASHSLTLNHPLRIQPAGEQSYLVNGTPTDCVSLALSRLLAEPPDLVFSGINRGTNLGYDVTYSGTVAAAFEGALKGVRSLAVSIDAAGDLQAPRLARLLTDVVERMLRADRPLLLNVNVPAGDPRGVRLTAQGFGGYRTEVIEKRDPRGNRYYWIGGRHDNAAETRPDSDICTVAAGYVSVTPLSLDLTDHAALAGLRGAWPAGSGVEGA